MSPIVEPHCGSALGSSMTTLVVNGVDVLPTGPTLYWAFLSCEADEAARPGVAVPLRTATLVWLGGHGPLLFFPPPGVVEAEGPPGRRGAPQPVPAVRRVAATVITAPESGPG